MQSVQPLHGKSHSGVLRHGPILLFSVICLLIFCCGNALAAQPESVTFSEHEITIDISVSRTYTIIGTVNPDTASQQLNWYSSDDRLLTVENGVITAHKLGEGFVRANVPGITAIGDKCIVHIVDSRVPSSLTINLPEGTLEPGDSAQITVTADNPKANTSVTWQTSSAGIAVVSEDGTLTAKGPGTCVITVTSTANTAVSASVQFTVKYLARPDSITLTEDSITSEACELHKLEYNISPAGASHSVAFTSSDDYIASVDADGVISFNSIGECDITVMMAGYPAVCDKVHVTVTDARVPERIAVYPSEITLEPSMGAKIEAVAFPDTVPAGFSYSSSNEYVATVDENGIVTAQAEGSCTIRVYSAFTNTIYADIPVTSKYGKALTSVSFDIKELTLQRGDTLTPALTVKPANGSKAVKLESSDENVLKVNYDGTVTAVHKGEATLTAYFYRETNIRSYMHVTVEDANSPEELIVTPGEHSVVSVGGSITLEISAEPAGTDQECTITTSHPETVALEGNTLTGLKRGMSEITVTSNANEELSVSFRVTVEDGTCTLEIPKRRTDIAGIDANLTRIENVRLSAVDFIDELYDNGTITEAEAADRKRIIDNAFDMYAFPWMVESEQRYWSVENSQNGAKNFKPGIVYYGMPYTSGITDLRAFSRENAITQERWLPVEGQKYYLLNQDKERFGTAYVGNDCSAFVALCLFEYTRVDGEIIKTSTLYFDDRLEWVADPADLRPGDILVRHSAHVVMFLYWADEAHTQAMFIEQGGHEYAINTVSVNVYDLSYYTDNYYRIRRLREWGVYGND